MSFRGVEFSPEMRKMVVNVKLFFDSTKKTPKALTRPASQLTATALNISESTVKVIINNGELNHTIIFRKNSAIGSQ